MRFISGEFEPETGITKVTVEHKGLNFVGKAKLHPEDVNFKSTYVGGEIAELRATVKALKYELKLKKEELKAITKFYNACIGCKKFNKYSHTAKVIFRQYNLQIRDLKDLKDYINDLQEQEKALIKARTKYIERFQKNTFEAKEILAGREELEGKTD